MRFTTLIFLSIISYIVTGQSIDKGIGVIYLTEALPTNQKPKNDTMLIYKNKDLKVIVSRFTFYNKDRFKNEVISRTKIGSNATFEFDEETFGLPITRIDTINDLAEIIYGYNPGEELKGWVRITDKKVGFQLWKNSLLNRELFFSIGEIKFYKLPDGEIENIKLVKSGKDFDYIMKPLKTSGNWLLVKVVTPSNYGDNSLKSVEKECWIKFLSDTGRPLVWYYTRD
jgi:hypothetical protein